MRKLCGFDANILYTCGLDVLCVVKWTLSNKRISTIFPREKTGPEVYNSKIYWFHIFHIGGSRGAYRVQAPHTGPNSFIFAYIFAKKHPHQRSTPPPPYGKSWIRHCYISSYSKNPINSICRNGR